MRKPQSKAGTSMEPLIQNLHSDVELPKSVSCLGSRDFLRVGNQVRFA